MDTSPDGESVLDKPDRPQTGAMTSEAVWRVNSTAMKVSAVFEAARVEARDECLWLSAQCRRLLDENDALRMQLEKTNNTLEKLRREVGHD